MSLDPHDNTKTAVITRSVFSGQRKIKYAFREKSYAKSDTGWRFVGDGDTQGYINHERNVLAIDLATLLQIESAVEGIINMPEGTELDMVEDETGRHFVPSVEVPETK